MDAYQQYIHKSRYARYLPEEQRRETWEETVNRYVNFWVDRGALNDFDVTGVVQGYPRPRRNAIHASTDDRWGGVGP